MVWFRLNSYLYWNFSSILILWTQYNCFFLTPNTYFYFLLAFSEPRFGRRLLYRQQRGASKALQDLGHVCQVRKSTGRSSGSMFQWQKRWHCIERGRLHGLRGLHWVASKWPRSILYCLRKKSRWVKVQYLLKVA